MQGYIRLHRKILEWEWSGDPKTFSVFITLILMANHEDKKWRGIVVHRGQLVTSYAHIAKNFKGVSVQNVRTIINRLKLTGELTIKTTNKYSVITITNYDFYQSDNSNGTAKSTSKLTNNQQTTNKQLTTNKNGKNGKKEKRENLKGKEETSYANFVDFFNGITGRKFKYSDKKAQRQYTYLVREGYKREDFEKVIRNAYADNYHRETGFKYLTPEFITRTDKWDRYLAMGDKVRLKPVAGEVVEDEKQRKFDETLKVLGF